MKLTAKQKESVVETRSDKRHASDLLKRFKPFEEWKAERPRSEDEILKYHQIKNELQKTVDSDE